MSRAQVPLPLSTDPGGMLRLERLPPGRWLINFEWQLPVLELGVSDSGVPAAADKIAGWLETTCGIYPGY